MGEDGNSSYQFYNNQCVHHVTILPQEFQSCVVSRGNEPTPTILRREPSLQQSANQPLLSRLNFYK